MINRTELSKTVFRMKFEKRKYCVCKISTFTTKTLKVVQTIVNWNSNKRWCRNIWSAKNANSFSPTFDTERKVIYFYLNFLWKKMSRLDLKRFEFQTFALIMTIQTFTLKMTIQTFTLKTNTRAITEAILFSYLVRQSFQSKLKFREAKIF